MRYSPPLTLVTQVAPHLLKGLDSLTRLVNIDQEVIYSTSVSAS